MKSYVVTLYLFAYAVENVFNAMKFKITTLIEVNNIHKYVTQKVWEKAVKKGDTIIDATCGNGHDSLYLANLALDKETAAGKLYCIDIQQNAIISTKKRLQDNGYTNSQVEYICGSHETFPANISPRSVSCITYNLGYLPGSSKHIITTPKSTIRSILSAVELVGYRGLLSVMAYRGHEGGPEEAKAIEEYFELLPANLWQLEMYVFKDKPFAPSLMTATLLGETK